ncbi:MAG: recombinase, partial [Mediterranea sp.]|nr:recombinase [Mediterranea sp.]
MKVSALLRKAAKKNDTDSQATIYFRLRDGNKDLKVASELSINPNHWSPEKQGYKDRVALISEEQK